MQRFACRRIVRHVGDGRWQILPAMPASPPGVSPPPDPSFRQRVLAGEQLLGTFLNLGSSLTAEIVALAGFDWALVDTEHGPGAEWHAVAQLQALGRTPGLVRVESLERTRILRALDAGAAGVLVPRLESADDAERAVSYARYAGERGVARSNRSWHWGSRGGTLADADAAVVTAVQIETAGALAAVDAIAAVDGVDVVFVGPNDLAHAIGLQGGPLAPDFVAHMQTVVAAARRHGKAAGIQVAAVRARARLPRPRLHRRRLRLRRLDADGAGAGGTSPSSHEPGAGPGPRRRDGARRGPRGRLGATAAGGGSRGAARATARRARRRARWRACWTGRSRRSSAPTSSIERRSRASIACGCSRAPVSASTPSTSPPRRSSASRWSRRPGRTSAPSRTTRSR